MTAQEFEAAAQAALAGITGGDGRMLNSFVLVAECIEDDGDRAVWFATSEGLKDWDSLGLLTYALVTEKASIGVADSDEGDECS